MGVLFNINFKKYNNNNNLSYLFDRARLHQLIVTKKPV